MGAYMVRDEPTRPLVGRSKGFHQAKTMADRVAKRRSSVLIFGETGTGKELLARYVHAQSNRIGKPFVPVDCSSLTETLFESELFGHVRGSFTGATRDSLGFVRAANGGSLFLDEIGELSLTAQAKLLRVIQERRVVPVGADNSIPVDFRLIAATHRDLEKMVAAGTFRQDLFFRLHVVVLSVPPLRDRKDDVESLSEHFLSAQAELYDEPVKALSAEASAALTNYHWPGNVRELANAIEQAHVLSTSETIGLLDLPPHIVLSAQRRGHPERPHYSDLKMDDVERRTILEALRRAKFNKSAASRLLGINIQRLTRRMSRLGVRLP